MEFDDFYSAERDGLVRLCYLVTLDVDAAADATQEAMLRAYARWGTLADQEPLAWVRRVALNLCHSRWRRIQREIRLAPKLYLLTATPEPSDSDLLAALHLLPARQREALVLRYWADLAVEDCARTMGVSVGTVNQHLSRARAGLRDSGALDNTEEPV
jgi:RNA polymerase sigma-70 factor (ECF subfamily)